MNREILLEKIRKLLSMAEGGTGNEADIAMKKLNNLMQTHGITKDDINLFESDIPAPVRMERWLRLLVGMCGDFSGVCVLGGRKIFTFAGDETGVRIANELYIYLKREIERKLKCNHIKGRKPRNDFRLGCVIGLGEKMERLGGWRDMQEKKERIREKYFLNLKTRGKCRNIHVNRQLYEAGKQNGEDINISRQASGGNSNAGLISGLQAEAV